MADDKTCLCCGKKITGLYRCKICENKNRVWDKKIKLKHSNSLKEMWKNEGHKKNMSNKHKGELNGMFNKHHKLYYKHLISLKKNKGGCVFKGYRFIYVNGEQVAEHKYIWMKNNNYMPIPKNYCIHHINLNKSNNRINNLTLLHLSFHTHLHNKIRGVC